MVSHALNYLKVKLDKQDVKLFSPGKIWHLLGMSQMQS